MAVHIQDLNRTDGLSITVSVKHDDIHSYGWGGPRDPGQQRGESATDVTTGVPCVRACVCVQVSACAQCYSYLSDAYTHMYIFIKAIVPVMGNR